MRLVVFLLVALSFQTAIADRGSMKGWEIYSWKCSAKPQTTSAPSSDSVCFALLRGTNRLKTTDEIRTAAIAIGALEERLATLAKGDDVFWTAPDDTFDLPDPARGASDPRNRAVAVMNQHGLKLTVTR